MFSLIFCGMIGGWCWSSIFIRLFTADSVRSVKKAAMLSMPWSILFSCGLFLLCMLASALHDVAAHPDDVWFTVMREAGGPLLLGLAGVCVLAASMGNIDGAIQAVGAMLANDIFAFDSNRGHVQQLVVAKSGMALLTVLSAWLACSTLPSLFSLAMLSFQGVIQLAVPLMLGIFWRRGTNTGAMVGLTVGFFTACTLEFHYRGNVPWAYGLSSGLIGLAINFTVYVACAYLFPLSAKERARIDTLFDSTSSEGRPLVSSELPESAVGHLAK